MVQRVGSSADAPTRTSERDLSSRVAPFDAQRAALREDTPTNATAPVDLNGVDDAAQRFALERERVLRRSEHSASVQRLRTALTLGTPLWTGSLLLDGWAVEVAGAGPFWCFALLRFGGALVALAVIYRLRQPIEPSPRLLCAMDLGTFTLCSALNAVMACCFGGVASPYATGLIVILVGRGSTTLEPRRNGAWMLGAPALAYPLVLLVAAQIDERIAAQFRDPGQRFMFVIFLCFTAMTWLHLTLGADFAWRWRRQALETRNIGRYKLVRLLGRGGMGEVWAAYDSALKIMSH